MIYITYLSIVFDQFVYLYRYCISELFRISNIQRFGKLVNDLKSLTIFGRCSVLDIWQCFEYAFQFTKNDLFLLLTLY